MKKLLFIAMLLISVPVLASDDCVGISAKASTIAKEDKGNRIMATDLALWYSYHFYDFIVTPHSNIKTWMIQNSSEFYRGMPFRDVYSIGGKTEWNNIGFDFDHYCSHSVCSGQAQWDSYNREPIANTSTGRTTYKIAESQLTKATLSYLLEIKDASAFFAAAKTLETKSFYLDMKLSYKIHAADFTFTTYANTACWTEDKRFTVTAGEQISYKSVSFDVQYYRSNKLLGRYNSNHVYDENPVTQHSVLISAAYRFNDSSPCRASEFASNSKEQ